jgi:hypothetical protein
MKMIPSRGFDGHSEVYDSSSHARSWLASSKLLIFHICPAFNHRNPSAVHRKANIPQAATPKQRPTAASHRTPPPTALSKPSKSPGSSTPTSKPRMLSPRSTTLPVSHGPVPLSTSFSTTRHFVKMWLLLAKWGRAWRARALAIRRPCTRR